MADNPKKARKKTWGDFVASREAESKAERDAIIEAVRARKMKRKQKARGIREERSKTPKVKEGRGSKRSRVERKRVPTRGKTTVQNKGKKPPLPYEKGRSGRQFGSLTKGKIDTDHPLKKRNIGGSARGTPRSQTLGPVNPVGRRQGEATKAMFGDRRALVVNRQGTRPGLAQLGDRLSETAKALGLPVTKAEGRRLVFQFMGKLPINESAVKGTFDLAKTKLGPSLTKFLEESKMSPSTSKGVNAVAYTLWRHAGKPNPRTKPFEAIVEEMTSMIKQGSFIQQAQVGTAPVGGRTKLGSLPPEAWRNRNMVEWPHVMTATAQNLKGAYGAERLGARTYLSPLPSYGEAGFAGLGQVGSLMGGEQGKHALLGEKAAVRQLLTGIAKMDKLKPGPTANISRLGTTHAQNLISDQFVALNAGKRQPFMATGGVIKGAVQAGSKGGLGIQRRVIQELMETPGGLLFFLARAMVDPKSGNVSISKRMQALAKTLNIPVQQGEGVLRVASAIRDAGGEVTDIAELKAGGGVGKYGRLSLEARKKLAQEAADAIKRDAAGTHGKGKLSKAQEQKLVAEVLLRDPEGGTAIGDEHYRQQSRELKKWLKGTELDDDIQRGIGREIAEEQLGARKAARAYRKGGGSGKAVQFGKSIAKGGVAGLILLALLTMPSLFGAGEDDELAA